MDRADRDELSRFVGLGSTLNDKYRIEGVLGVGGMGVVVAARHLKLGESVAIKFLLPRAIGQGRQVQRFVREARSAGRIRSPHVARVFDIDVRADGVPFIVMEHLAGETLGERIKREGPFGVERAVDQVLEACQAVAEAHTLGIVHRDLKPGNLFLARGAGNIELVKVLDFGISKVVEPASFETEQTTGDGFVGSPPYMSPEQLTDPANVDLRTDIWSLGVILYECLTGKAPFKADSVGQILALILQSRPPVVSELRADLPPGVVSSIERCLVKQRDDRYPDVLSLARDLAAYGTERGRRALTVIEAVSVGQDAQEVVTSDSSVPEPTLGELDTGTLSAAAQGPRQSTPPPRRKVVPRGVWLLAALAAAVSLFLGLRGSHAPERPADATTTEVASATIPELIPSVTAAESARIAAASAPSASAPPAKPRPPRARGTLAAPAATAAPSGFDPVFDERR